MNQTIAQQPLRAYTLNEIRYYLRVMPCAACGKGPWAIDSSSPPDPASRLVTVRARCHACGDTLEQTFCCELDLPAEGAESEVINPTDSPSRLIDLGGWLSLFYLLIESAAADPVVLSIRRQGYQATLCLAEALKFYGEDELPGEGAFFSAASAQAFRDHPEKFARQKLRDILSRLPALPLMARRISADERKQRPRWWRFWMR
ncbi:MAG: hypothetical protein WC869_09945 [Phycisphaerae bacterium]|jgi:hypothetical protein